MTNALEVCEWLIKRPDILFMAYHMYNAMNTPLDSQSKMPPDEAIEENVTKIFNYDLCSSNATEVICHSKRVLTDFCNKFNFKVNTRILKGTNKTKLKGCGTMEQLILLVREIGKDIALKISLK
ncbi:8458_t:CDS:2 [Funneliformis mosseae]|uniref:8458_t:CDS:1 n=1 Tax=Funneliformis mosseae TaxID=27381 RepID=A0A9N9BZY4_FUNMO|nr:8458_t:CDS:2 [Funneliformis mosseae]